jgi:hypothetical protein
MNGIPDTHSYFKDPSSVGHQEQDTQIHISIKDDEMNKDLCSFNYQKYSHRPQLILFRNTPQEKYLDSPKKDYLGSLLLACFNTPSHLNSKRKSSPSRNSIPNPKKNHLFFSRYSSKSNRDAFQK